MKVKMEFSKAFEGGRMLKVSVSDLLGVSVDAIVNPANSGLSHGGGLSKRENDKPQKKREI